MLDHATPIGEVIVAAPTYKRLIAEFTGHEAHAGINPEDGHSAIAAAAAAIGGDEAGAPRRGDDRERRHDRGRHGLQRRRRALPDPRRGAQHRRRASRGDDRGDGRCLHLGGRRARLRRRRACDRDVPRLPARRQVGAGAVASEALRRTGHEPELVATGGGSDANALVAAGFEAVLLANGTEANHTPEESVAEAAIVEMLGVCEAAIEEAAQVVTTAGGG